jgi:hypothetical protein
LTKAFARFLVVLALAAQGPVSDLEPNTDEESRPSQPSSSLVAWIQASPATDLCVRSDAPDDDDSSELDEAGAACLAPVFAGASTPLRPVDAPVPAAAELTGAQDSPGPSPSRAPPLL